MITTEETQYGVRYLNGEEDWKTRDWFGHIETKEMRESFQEQYNLRLKMFGAPPMPVSFLTRTVTTNVSDAVVIDDTVPDAPEEDAEPPALKEPGEGESAAETDNKTGETNGVE